MLKKRILFIGIAAVIVLIILIIVAGIKLNKITKEIDALKIESLDFTKVKDGIYEGKCDMTIVTAKVNVKVEKGKVTGIDILEHIHGNNYGADKIIEKIISSQSLNVDSITGATGSSKVMKKAVENALKKGE